MENLQDGGMGTGRIAGACFLLNMNGNISPLLNLMWKTMHYESNRMGKLGLKLF